jgi:diguanylate cyclase (GGDEF)-like protein
MANGGKVVEKGQRAWSLRREWARAFNIMVVLLLIAASIAIVGVWGVVDQVAGSARELRHESALIAILQTDIVNHEEVGHKLLSDEAVDRSAYISAQQEISRRFAQAVALFPTTDGMKATVGDAQRSWQSGLKTFGLWSTEVRSLHGNHEVENPIYGASSDNSVAMVDGLQAPSLLALDRGLSQGSDLEKILIGALSGLFGLALAVTAYFRRRMVKDLLQPVAKMRHGVSKLQAGQYDHHIDVARRDELGELTDAFNEMAGALRESHVTLSQRAANDSLTGLANRASLTERLVSSFGPGADRRARQESVLFIDVDDFKVVNDSLGHEGGDALLVQLASRLRCCVRPADLVARLGGDEFAVVVAEDQGGQIAAEIAERILATLRTPFSINSTNLVVSVSIGGAQRHPETADAAELLRRADFAMYMAKGSGKGRYQIFDAQVHDNMVGRSALKTDLAQATMRGELRVEYQPVANLRTGEILGVEALVRWQHPTLGLLAPVEFIGLAEETGDIDAIGCWVLSTAIDQLARWRQALEHCANLWMSVNLSPFQLRNPHAMAGIQEILSGSAVEAGHVVLEVTETALAVDGEHASASLATLKKAGVRIAVDDFGSGFSTLSTLATLPVDILKIDRSFVSGQAMAASWAPMLDGILSLAGKLCLEVIAEGIETPEQLELLCSLGCPMGQGYFLGRPMPADQLGARLARGGMLEAAKSAN